MTSDLIKKEHEYRKLNEELETRTKKLMREVDEVMKKQNNVNPEIIPSRQNRKCDPINVYTSENISNLFESNGYVNNVPDCVKDMGVKGMTQFYLAKLKKLQSDYEKLHSEYKSKCEGIKKLENENHKLREEKEKWFQMSTGHKTHINKLETQLSTLQLQMQSKDNENYVLKKEIDQLQKDLKSETINVSNAELRLKKSLEESEKNKTVLKNVKQQEKDLRENHHKQVNELSNIIKKIEKHKIEILTGFKKQLLLIDNLKKQKAHIENCKLTEKADNDFIKILDWKIYN